MNLGSVELGDRIVLNRLAPEWTRGVVFTIAEIKGWGVVCWTTDGKGYRALWAHMERLANDSD